MLERQQHSFEIQIYLQERQMEKEKKMMNER